MRRTPRRSAPERWTNAPRLLIVLVVAALVASGCATDERGDDREGSASPIDDALGTQAVQDFAIHLGMWAMRESGPVDLLSPLVAQVAPGDGEPVPLVGGLTLAPATELAAGVVDASRQPIPSLDVDFGLLRATPEAETALAEELLADAQERGDAALITSLESGAEASASMLVEIVSADYTVQRVHGAPGDRVELDVTFLDEVAPGDDVAVDYIFGQTYPGDAEAEEGLGSFELFVHRWNHGLFRILGHDQAPRLLLDDDLQAIEGSTILSRELKGVLMELAGAAEVATAEFTLRKLGGEIAIRQRWMDPTPGSGPNQEVLISTAEVELPGTDETLTVELADIGGRSESPYRVRLPSGERTRAMSREELFVFVIGYRAFAACLEAAAALAAHNEAGRAAAADLEGAEDPAAEADRAADDSPDGDSPPPGCDDTPDGGSGGAAFGDVRITTLDGVLYGQQAPGEFLLFENETMTAQMRTEPVEGSDRLTVATGFAVATGGESIAMHRGGRTFLNGEPVELRRGERIRVGEAEVLWGFFDWTLVWPDGQIVKVFDRDGADAMSLTAESVVTPVIGQLGDGDGSPQNDFVTRGGTVLDPSIVDDPSAFYGTFVDSWRLTEDESLLHHAAGETTASFTIDGFPSLGFDGADLGPAAFELATAICDAAAIEDEQLHEACVIDVGATNDAGFAYDAFRVQLVTTPRVDLGGGGLDDPPPASPGPEPGDTLLTIGDETLVFGVDPPNQRPLGIQASWNCQIIDGNLFADGSIDLADGPRYAITVQYLAAEPRLTLILTTPNEDGITRNYAWVETRAPHFADAIDAMTLDDQRFTVSGELYVNESLEQLAAGSELPDGATFDPFTLDLNCSS